VRLKQKIVILLTGLLFGPLAFSSAQMSKKVAIKKVTSCIINTLNTVILNEQKVLTADEERIIKNTYQDENLSAVERVHRA
jgi:uncharacterized FlgJ-related protein